MRKKSSLGIKLFWALLSGFFLIVVISSGLYLYIDSQLPEVDLLKTVKLQVPLRIFSQEGLLIQEYGEKRRIPAAYEEIPQTLIHAVLATEDQRFFEHPGVDVFGLARAAVRMLQTGTKSQGGSTITMQVARNFFLDRRKTFLRKLNEIVLAIKIDHQLPKEKILELYLNKIYLGNRAYGVGAAAQIYYGKKLNELNLAEMAMIAGLPQAPSTQNPIINPEAAQKRRDHVLERLLEEHFITPAAFNQALAEPVFTTYHGAKSEVTAPYVAEMIRESLYNHFGEDAYTKGYKVFTTIKASLQNTADKLIELHLINYDKRHGYRGPVAHLELAKLNSQDLIRELRKYPIVNDLEPAMIQGIEPMQARAYSINGETILIPWSGLSWARPALKKGWMGKAPKTAADVLKIGDLVYIHRSNDHWELSQIPELESALVALNPQNGAIESLVGGLNFEKSKFNRVTQSERQPGSSFKPFIYAAALNKGYTLATLVNDAPIVVDDPSQANLWRPHNDNDTFEGPTRLKEALIHSRNLVSIRILDDIGISYTLDFLKRFGFNQKSLPQTLSLALGTSSVSPMDLTVAYAIFANGGYKIEPYLIDHITDTDDHIMLQANPKIAKNQFNPKLKDNQQYAPKVLSEDIVFLINKALSGVVKYGTAQQASALKRNDIAGKTGTTNDQMDAWFSGYNPELVATTWIGYDTPHPLHEYANRLALPLWIDFMKNALLGKPELQMAIPANITTAVINPLTGLIASHNHQSNVIEYFQKNHLPETEETPQESEDESVPRSENASNETESLF